MSTGLGDARTWGKRRIPHEWRRLQQNSRLGNFRKVLGCQTKEDLGPLSLVMVRDEEEGEGRSKGRKGKGATGKQRIAGWRKTSGKRKVEKAGDIGIC